jgi:hypothetical protein
MNFQLVVGIVLVLGRMKFGLNPFQKPFVLLIRKSLAYVSCKYLLGGICPFAWFSTFIAQTLGYEKNFMGMHGHAVCLLSGCTGQYFCFVQ